MTTLQEFLAEQQQEQKLIDEIRRNPKPERLVTVYGGGQSGSFSMTDADNSISGTNQIVSLTVNSSNFPVNTYDTITNDGTNGITFTAPFSRYYRIRVRSITIFVVDDANLSAAINSFHTYFPFELGTLDVDFNTDSSTGFISQSEYRNKLKMTYSSTGPNILQIEGSTNGYTENEGIVYLETGERFWIDYDYNFLNLRNFSGFNSSSAVLSGFTFFPIFNYLIEEVGVDY